MMFAVFIKIFYTNDAEPESLVANVALQQGIEFQLVAT
jgi:hypothetical protein